MLSWHLQLDQLVITIDLLFKDFVAVLYPVHTSVCGGSPRRNMGKELRSKVYSRLLVEVRLLGNKFLKQVRSYCANTIPPASKLSLPGLLCILSDSKAIV